MYVRVFDLLNTFESPNFLNILFEWGVEKYFEN